MKQVRMNRILKVAFSDMEIADAKENLVLFPIQEDLDNAVRMDPRHCVFANCAHRVCGATQVHFFKRWAYIDHVDKEGVRKVHRYSISANVYKSIVDFDRGKTVKINKAFILNAPGPKMTLKAQRKYAKEWYKSNTAKAIVAESKALTKLKAATVEFEKATNMAAQATSVKAEKVASQMLKSANKELEKARINFDTAKARATEARSKVHTTGRASRPKTYDLSVRSGTGYFIKEIGKSHANNPCV